MKSRFAQTMLDSVPARKQKTLASLFPNASADALDLMVNLLQFNPERRLTAVQVLEHPYLAQFHDPAHEPELTEPINISMDDNSRYSISDYRRSLYKRIVQRKQGEYIFPTIHLYVSRNMFSLSSFFVFVFLSSVFPSVPISCLFACVPFLILICRTPQACDTAQARQASWFWRRILLLLHLLWYIQLHGNFILILVVIIVIWPRWRSWCCLKAVRPPHFIVWCGCIW